LIIFTHAGGNRDYQVDRVVHYPEAEPISAHPKPTPVGGVKVVA